MKSIKTLLSGIGCLLIAILSFLLGNTAGWEFMGIPCLIAFVIGSIFIIVGILGSHEWHE